MAAVAYTTLAEARDIAYGYRKRARAGIDPRSRRASNSVPTFAEAAAGALERAYQRSDLLAARREVMEAWSRHIS